MAKEQNPLRADPERPSREASTSPGTTAAGRGEAAISRRVLPRCGKVVLALLVIPAHAGNQSR